tara:strand:+ start:2375 stop:3310 length:936 start_codon:yes stop_codon:yes gene_type:complete
MATQVQTTMGGLEWTLLVTLSDFWGGSFFFMEVAVASLPPLTVVVLRVGLAALALNILLPLAGVRMPHGLHVWRAFLVMGILNNLMPFTLIVWGQTHIDSGLASILNATTPLLTVLVAHVLTTDEKATSARMLGVVVGFIGVALMIGPDVLRTFDGSVAGQLAVLGAGVSYAFAGIYGRRFVRMELSPMTTATGQLTASTVIFIPLTLVVDQPWALALPDGWTIGAVIALALFSTVLAYVIYFRILATAGATNLLLVTFLVPVSAILLGTLILGEQLDVRHFTGMALISVGLAVIDGRLRRLCGSPARFKR